MRQVLESAAEIFFLIIGLACIYWFAMTHGTDFSDSGED